MTADEFWAGIFGRSAPVEIEIGPGRGALLFALAAAAPERNFFAIEHSFSRTKTLIDTAHQRGLSNVRVLHGDAICVIASLVPPDSVTTYHIAFPDPWWKRRHHRRRLFTPAFAAALTRTLVPGGSVDVVTDVEAYFQLMTKLLSADLQREEAAPTSVVTRFAQKANARGATIRAARFRKVTASPAVADPSASDA